MFSFQPISEQSSVLDSQDTTVDSKTIRFVEKCTIIQERRRKTVRPPRILQPVEEDDPELEEILSLGSMDIDRDSCQLPRIMAMVMASIIDDAAESSCIMSKTFGLPEVQIDMAQRTLQDRNEQLRSHSTIFNPETLEEYSKTENAYMIQKLHSDILFLKNILGKGVKTLLMESNYHMWLLYIDNYDMQLEQDTKLLDMVETKTQKLQELKEKLHTDKIQFQIDCDELANAIGRARDEMEDFIIQAEIKQVYLDNWEKSRRQQNYRVKTEKENIYQQRITKARTESRKENRVHIEIGSYMSEFFKDTEDSIQEWMETYDKDMETKDEEIVKTGFRIEDLGNDLIALKAEYDKRTAEMDAWLEKKAEIERMKEELRFFNRMATIIQAWWRGTMYRKKLGPYRPVKRGRKKDKKKK